MASCGTLEVADIQADFMSERLGAWVRGRYA